MTPTNSIEKLIWGKKLQCFFLIDNNFLNYCLGFIKKFGKVRMSVKSAQIYFTTTQLGFVQFVDYFIKKKRNLQTNANLKKRVNFLLNKC